MTSFGFGPSDNSDDAEKSAELAAALEAMQAQMKDQFEKLGINPARFINPLLSNSAKPEPLPKTIVRDTAKKFTQAHGSQPVGANDVAEIKTALDLAQLWLDDKTDFSLHTSESRIALSRTDWVDTSLAGWQETVEPLAAGLADALAGLLSQASEAADQAFNSDGSLNEEFLAEAGVDPNMFKGPNGENILGGIGNAHASMDMIGGLLKGFIGSLIATQLGQAIGQLSASVTGIHDVGLPLITPAHPALIPQNINQWAQDLDVPIAEVRLFHALREAAIARLFDNNPWLVSYLRQSITDYGRGITIDMDAIQDQATSALSSADIDLNNPESFANAINKGLFTPEESESQKAALTKLEVALALIDGWVDEVVTTAAGERLPNLEKLRETLRRHRATNAPTKQLFSSLLGLEVSPRLAREASAFWRSISELSDISTRDKIWSGILPTQEELLNPQLYLASVEVPDDLSGLL
ncbi:MAG: zinc-dependent metalloprotease [Actinobacteria bacterium]|nr:zinc-dependent metalloprotease [Actinomycetota bacterium]